MGCCEVKKELNSTLELDLNAKNDCSFNDISISSHHCYTSNLINNANCVTSPNSSRARSISLTFPNTLEHAFLVNSPSNMKANEVTKAVVFMTSEETCDLRIILEKIKDRKDRLDI
ncbi:hypothetical protein SteCoe_26038 [Stentor coeruleus]|uniref:Uncharacterized protein n=1 Tax=Stentor coeruleus TaxID=5963 RepID=A0A1R2BDV6_9CILI|nr:hypothetical protein SteCoe_26038 [Stentor coeruleus]